MRSLITICSVAVVALALYGCGSGYMSEYPGESGPNIVPVNMQGSVGNVNGGVTGLTSMLKTDYFSDASATTGGALNAQCSEIVNTATAEIQDFEMNEINYAEAPLVQRTDLGQPACSETANPEHCLNVEIIENSGEQNIYVTGNIDCAKSDGFTLKANVVIAETVDSTQVTPNGVYAMKLTKGTDTATAITIADAPVGMGGAWGAMVVERKMTRPSDGALVDCVEDRDNAGVLGIDMAWLPPIIAPNPWTDVIDYQTDNIKIDVGETGAGFPYEGHLGCVTSITLPVEMFFTDCAVGPIVAEWSTYGLFRVCTGQSFTDCDGSDFAH